MIDYDPELVVGCGFKGLTLTVLMRVPAILATKDSKSEYGSILYHVLYVYLTDCHILS